MGRHFVDTMRFDHRLRRVIDGAIAKAMMAEERRHDLHRDDPRRFAHNVAKAAAMELVVFFLEEDRELKETREQLDRLAKTLSDRPVVFGIPFPPPSPTDEV